MKKRIIALLICAHMILSAAAPIAASAKGLTEKTLTPDIPLSDAVAGDETDTDDEITEPSDEENGSETGDPESSDEENNSGSEGDGSADGTDNSENPDVTPEDGNGAEGTPPPVDENNDGGANFGGEGNEPVVGENGTEVVEPGSSDTEVVLDEGDDELTEDERAQALQAAWDILNNGTSYVPTSMPYIDFICQEADKAWENPEIYLGYTASFNTNFTKICFATDTQTADIDDEKNYINAEVVQDSEGKSIEVVITGYYVDETAEGGKYLWYQIEAADGYELPEAMGDSPYIFYYDDQVEPSLLMLPKQGMFVGEEILVGDKMVATANFKSLQVSKLPKLFDLTTDLVWVKEDEFGTDWYDISKVISASEQLISEEYRYVPENYVGLLPLEVCKAYEDLLSAKSYKEFEDILVKIPHSVLEQFTAAHKTNATKHLTALENVKYETTVFINEIEVPVSVSGRIPTQGLTLKVGVVEDKDVKDAGFALDNVTDIIAALDIKLTNNSDDSEWQPEEGELIAVSIGIGALGYEDGSIVQLQHKHGEDIEMFEIFIVLDGAVTVYTGGMSIYLVNEVRKTQPVNATVIDNGGSITMEVGDTAVYYFNPGSKGSWTVIDTTGAVYYTVYAQSASATASNNGVSVPWIKIVALKEATGITLRYNRENTSNNETFTLNITGPKATTGGKLLYLKDEVNTTGSIIATLVNENGEKIENGLVGAKFSWERSDGMFIVPQAYGNNYSSVNIARDHGGMVESRKNDDGTHKLVTYTVTVTLFDGTELSADYTVYYQSEVLNSGFEAPKAQETGYSFFPNGWDGLFWKTTAQGTGSNVTKDIEYGDVTGGKSDSGNGDSNGTNYGTLHAADHASNGHQFAELNAEEFGALYQDIITAPGEDIEWSFSHAPRPHQSWGTNITNSMYIIIGATEDAQKLTTQAELEALGQAAKGAGLSATKPVKVTYKNKEYQVWYHDAGTANQNVNENSNVQNNPYTQAKNYGWTKLEGSYTVPQNQYRTRVFFVSDKKDSNAQNAGNLIDSARVGQYKKYLIEYYEETFVNGEKIIKYRTDLQDSGEALIYSSVKLTGVKTLTEIENAYLHQIFINGSNYPYDIRYAGDASLYIEKYEGTAQHQENVNHDPNNDYSKYDIVMQIFVRDTVIAVQKEIKFPVDTEGNELLTAGQKLELMNEVSSNGGYKADFRLYATDNTYNTTGQAVITQIDPVGQCKGYISIGENPEINHSYVIQETKTTPLKGLVLDSVEFKTVRYQYGKGTEPSVDPYYEITVDRTNTIIQELKTQSFELNTDYKIAEVTVVNKYVEKMTTINYVAVGNGKVAITPAPGVQPDFSHTPSETLAFYSGKAIGAMIYPGKNRDNSEAKFVGWFKDEACTKPINPVVNSDGTITSAPEGADGVWDNNPKSPTYGQFKPNANILDAEEVFFYAKFETGSFTIERKGAEPGQTFVYHVTRQEDEMSMYVTITCGADGNGKATVFDVTAGSYTVDEIGDWSWRYKKSDPITKEHSGEIAKTPEEQAENTFVFGTESKEDDPEISKHYWLNGYSNVVKNIFNAIPAQQGGTD